MGFWIFKTRTEIEKEKQEKQIALKKAELIYQKEQEELKRKRDAIKENYETSRKEYGYTKSGRKSVTLRNDKYYIFKSDGHLKFFIYHPQKWDSDYKKIPQWKKQSIPIQNIKYFSREGEVYTETKISGGSGGSNLGDAIIGGIIAGAPGAIIASRGKPDPIKSETIKHDSRRTVLVYNEGTLNLAPEDYNVLMQLIPEKEISVVKQMVAQEKAHKPEPTIEDRLEQLKNLRDKNLISEEEYSAKKAEILREL